MPSAHPPKSSEALSSTDVEKIIDARINEYKRIAKAFLLGFSLLIIFLIANRLVSQNSLLVFLHDQIFGSERYLAGAINKSVALSYSNRFELDSNTPIQYLGFYANPTQTVIGLIDIKHTGADSPNAVLVKLDGENQIWSGVQDLNFSKIDLTKMVREPAQMSSTIENVHTLSFQISRSNLSSDDHVYIRALINVIGLESKSE